MSLIVVVLLLSTFYIHLGWAITCNLTTWGWASNSLGQNPCTIVEQLEGSCLNEAYSLDPLTPGTNYVTPQKNADPSCECNTVMYSLYQACTGCQNATFEGWSFYEKFCSTVYVSTYPVDIPPDTRIPHWAYLDVTKADIFDATSASLAAGLPESTPLSPSTVSNPSSSPSSTSPPVSSTKNLQTSSTASPVSTSSSSSKSNTGAIAGGVVGGIVVLALIGAAIAYLLYRRRQSAAHEAYPSPGIQEADAGYNTMDMTHVSPPRTYNPADPTTFPVLVGSAAHHLRAKSDDSSHTDNPSYVSFPQTTSLAQNRGAYKGFAEV